MSAYRYLRAAENVARVVPAILAEHGLKVLINGFVLTETKLGHAWLFVVLDDRLSEFHETFAAPSVLSHISMALHGYPVMFSQTNGLRYAILLSPPGILARSHRL